MILSLKNWNKVQVILLLLQLFAGNGCIRDYTRLINFSTKQHL